MTVEELNNILKKIKDKQLKVTIYDDEYRQYYSLEEIKIKIIPKDIHYANNGEKVIVLYS